MAAWTSAPASNSWPPSRADFAWPRIRLLLETDGYAWHRQRADYRADRERANAYAELGWTLLRVTWEDVVHRPDHVALVRTMLNRRPVRS